MAADVKTDRRMTRRCHWIVLVVLWFAVTAAAQNPLSLSQATARKAPDYGPVHLGETVVIRGQVATAAYRFPAYTVLGLQDGSGGAILQVPTSDTRLDLYRPGDELQVTGTVGVTSGMPVILPLQLTQTGRGPVPSPEKVPVGDLQNFQRL